MTKHYLPLLELAFIDRVFVINAPARITQDGLEETIGATTAN